MQDYISFLFSINKINAIISRKLHFNGIDFSDYTILYHLNTSINKRLSRIDLAKKLGLSPSGITRILLPLEKRGIIISSEDPSDARIKNAALTKAGKKLLEEAKYSLEIMTEDILKNENNNSFLKTKKFLDEMAEGYTQDEYKKEAKEKWGNTKAFKQSEERTKKMSKEEINKIKEKTNDLTQSIADVSDKGITSKEVQNLIKEHYKDINFFYDCSFEMYLELGEMYVKDLKFAAYYNKFKPGFSRFMRNAIKEFVKKNNT